VAGTGKKGTRRRTATKAKSASPKSGALGTKGKNAFQIVIVSMISVLGICAAVALLVVVLVGEAAKRDVFVDSKLSTPSAVVASGEPVGTETPYDTAEGADQDIRSAEQYSVPPKETPQAPTPVAVSIIRQQSQVTERPIPEALRSTVPVKGTIILVIDDAGNNRHKLERFLTLTLPLTFAVLPGLPGTKDQARLIRAAGKNMILHQPMEALGGQDGGPGRIEIAMGDGAIRRRIEENIAQEQGLTGANNHMGSKGTQQAAVLRPLMEELARRGLYFLDSRTSAASIARAIASEVGLPFAERDVFLDNDNSLEAMRAMLLKTAEIAAHKGHAIAIGHVQSTDLPVLLAEEGPKLEAEGFRFESLDRFMLSQGKGRR